MTNEKPTFIKDIEDQFRGVRGRGKRNNRHPFAVSHEQADMTDLATSASHWKTQMLQANGLQSEAELEAKGLSITCEGFHVPEANSPYRLHLTIASGEALPDLQGLQGFVKQSNAALKNVPAKLWVDTKPHQYTLKLAARSASKLSEALNALYPDQQQTRTGRSPA